MKTILYVDDTAEDRELMELAFAKSGTRLRLETVSSGELGRAYLEGSGEFADRGRFPFPDLVLLDLKMTGMSGFDVLRWMRHRPHTAKVMALIYSSSFVDSDVETACKLGADSFITKPSTWQRQLEVVRILQECLLAEPPDLKPLTALPEFRTCPAPDADLSPRP